MEIATELGLSLSAVVKSLLKQFIRTKRLEVGLEEKPSKYFVQSIKKSRDQLKRGETSPTFDTAKDAIKWLHESKA